MENFLTYDQVKSLESKKILMKNLFFLICILCSTVIYSQKIKLGIQVGAVRASQYFTTPYQNFQIIHRKPIQTFSADIVIQTSLNNKLKLELNPGYIGMGFGNDNGIPGLTIDYIHMPILLDYFPIKKLSINVGPELGYTTRKLLIAKSVELSGVLGVQYDVTNHFAIGLRGNKDIIRNSIVSYTDDNGKDIGNGGTYNQYYQALIRCSF
jgi:hypothetical protein